MFKDSSNNISLEQEKADRCLTPHPHPRKLTIFKKYLFIDNYLLINNLLQTV